MEDYKGFSPQYAASVLVPCVDLGDNIKQGHYDKNSKFPVLDDVYAARVSNINAADRHYSVAASGIVSCLVKLAAGPNNEVAKDGSCRGTPLCPIDVPFKIGTISYCWFQVQLHQ